MTQDILIIIIYKSLILHQFDYCSEVWGNLGKTTAADLQKLQNRAARIITSSSYEIRSDDILTKLNWKKLNERRQSQFASMMYKCVHNKVPVYLSDIFSTTSSVHNHNLRNSNRALFVPRPNNESGKRSFSFRGAVLWNSLPKACQVARNYANFLRSLP